MATGTAGSNSQYINDPMVFAKLLWPDVHFYTKQRDIIYSVMRDDETVVPAANMMGKDFVAGFIAVWFFMTRRPCRVVTTSATADHLDVLWGEMKRFIDTAKYGLTVDKGGPLIVNDMLIRKQHTFTKEVCKLSYIKGMVASPDHIAAMQGHHTADIGDGVPRTLFMSDESSSVQNDYYKMADGWANRKFMFGNTWDCDNYFKHLIEGVPGTEDHGGDLPRDPDDISKGYYRKMIRITADDSPNVRLAKAQIAAGMEPTNEVIQPGVLSWDKYVKRRKFWDAQRQCIQLDAQFYKGKAVMLFPEEWLARSRVTGAVYDWCMVNRTTDYQQCPQWTPDLGQMLLPLRRKAKGIGIDPAEGGDNTSMAASDEFGLMDLESVKTPDTNQIFGQAIRFITKHKVDPGNVCIDRGGGGKQLADRLRDKGYDVRTVAFGESVTPDPKIQSTVPVVVRIDEREERYAYVNRRAMLYGTLSELMDPSINPAVYGIPMRFMSILKPQLSPIPKIYQDDRLALPPKRKRNAKDKTVTLIDLIGHSPDEADATVLSIYAMTDDPNRPMVGAMYDVGSKLGKQRSPVTGGDDRYTEVGAVDLFGNE